MKIYAVSTGRYSDYRIEGIYSTKEKAQEAHCLYAADNDIEEYELDAMPEHPPGMLHYFVKMDEQGNASFVEIRSAEHMPNFDWSPYGDNKNVGFNVWAKDEIHAIKISNEKRAQLIATNRWTTDFNLWRKNEN